MEGEVSVPTHELICQRTGDHRKPEPMFVRTDVAVKGLVVACVGESVKRLGRLDVYAAPLPVSWFGTLWEPLLREYRMVNDAGVGIDDKPIH